MMWNDEPLKAGTQVAVTIGDKLIHGVIVGLATTGVEQTHIIKCNDGFLPNETYDYDTFVAPRALISTEICRRFRKIGGFVGPEAYIEVTEDCQYIVMKDGIRQRQTYSYHLNTCLRMVNDGVWEEFSDV